ncbi:hypothetical protein [Mycobacterium botniense]|uniref:Uncharacterized protein n=1 Tax=Mycobacterium botniense TaxID=84962 RepID=A0A7I9XU16_9MYCO|nr:hypothetical protein [Mycobacterium botniense]GFG73503.1 hypothetical protein MBOT_08680 [Mycobacterium botniense]
MTSGSPDQSAMDQKQRELIAELQAAHERNEHLMAVNDELRERLSSLTEAYATLIGDAMNLAEVKDHMPTLAANVDPQWCAQATAALCRSR